MSATSGTALRTPERRFEALPGYPFEPHYDAELPGFEGLRLHYLDEASDNAKVALCLHGQPTWSYLYRRMIPGLTQAGYRVIAPDFFGFGKSDKPADDADYTFAFHRSTILTLIETLDLERITLVCQDWGGLIGLTIPMAMPERFEAALIMNTTLGTGDQPLSQGFIDWRAWSNKNPDMAIGKLMARSCPHLSPAEVAAYDAPFPSVDYKAGVRRFPNLVPDHPNADGAALSREARDWWADRWRGKTAMVVGAADPVLGPPVMSALAKSIHGCPAPVLLPEAGHFVQEWGADVLSAARPLLA